MTGSQTSLRTLLSPVRSSLIAACAIQSLAAMSGIVPLVSIAEIGKIALTEAEADPARLWVWAVTAVAALAAKFALTFIATTITHKADSDFQLHLRQRIVQHLSRVPLGWFDKNGSGSLKKLLQDDVGALHYLVGHSVPDMTSALVTPVFVLGYLAWLDWRLAALAAIPLVLGLITYTLSFFSAGQQMKEYGRNLKTMNAAAIAYVQGIGPIKVFGRGDQAFATFKTASDAFLDHFWNMLRPAAPFMALSEILLAPVSGLLIVASAGVLVFGLGATSLAVLLPALILAPAITGAMAPFFYAQNDMMLANKAAARIAAVLDAPILEDGTGAVATPLRPDVSFENVAFSYAGERNAVTDVSFELTPGTMTALVGPSGSGKTTIARLLPRFWDVTHGSIRIGGRDIRDIPFDALYRLVSFVFQDTQLQSASIAQNIAMARPDANQTEIVEAAKRAFIHDKIMSLPKGYEAVIGLDANLSGGEAQRIAIARAILAEAPILVLDEATAMIDPETEAEVQQALSHLARDKTLLMIAHRLNTIVAADQIIVMDRGRISEMGTHATLLANGALYAEMWQALDAPYARDQRL